MDCTSLNCSVAGEAIRRNLPMVGKYLTSQDKNSVVSKAAERLASK